MSKKRIITTTIITLIVIITIVIIFCNVPKNPFDITQLKSSNINSNIEILTSEPYYGRLTGSEENEKVLMYIENEFQKMGIKPAGYDGTYYQPFSTIAAQIDNTPVFTVPHNGLNTAKELTIYKDYNLIPSMNGGSIDFSGDLLLVKDKLFSIDIEDIKNRVIVIEAKELSSQHIDYVIENGGKGIFCCADYDSEGKLKKLEQQKHLCASDKTTKGVAAGYISREIYQYLQNLNEKSNEEEQSQDIISNVYIKAQIKYPIIESANVLGMIEGRESSDEVLIISADIDGAGWGVDGEYFEGAIRNASGVCVLLELARVMANQDSVPYQSIVFIGFNGQEQNFAGSEYYAQNPIYPMENTKIIHLEAVGIETKNGLLIYQSKNSDIALRDTIVDLANKEGLNVTSSVLGKSAVSSFSNNGAQAVVMSDLSITRNTYEDKKELIDKDYLENAALTVLNYVKTEVFRDSSFSEGWKKFIAAISAPIDFVKGIFTSGTDSISEVGNNMPILLSSVVKSLLLILFSMVLSIAVGITGGLNSGYRAKRKSLSSLAPIIGLSIPDVLIILLGWRVITLYGMYLPKLESILPISSFIMPLLTVSILPMIYISRITFVTVQEETKRDYLRNSKAKGYSKRRIIYSELLPAAMFNIIDTLPTIMTMIIGNLIIVECLYNYLGAAYYLLYFYGRNAYFEFVFLLIALGLIYTVFTWVVQFIAKSANPAKREVKK